MKLNNWWKRAFVDGVFPLIPMTRLPEWRRRSVAEVGFLRRALGLRRGARVLDLACGTGRHSVELARSGMDVTGVDVSRRYLAEARRNARRRGVRVRWHRGDMRRLSFNGEFDAAVNLWTSFGYFTKAGDDSRVLRGVRRALKPGGIFVIEIMNGAFVRERMEYSHRRGWPLNDWTQDADGSLTLQEPRLLRSRNAMQVHWIFLSHDGCREMVSFVRLYTRATVSRLLRRAGLEVMRVLGGWDGAPYAPLRSRRMLVIARKPGTEVSHGRHFTRSGASILAGGRRGR